MRRAVERVLLVNVTGVPTVVIIDVQGRIAYLNTRSLA